MKRELREKGAERTSSVSWFLAHLQHQTRVLVNLLGQRFLNMAFRICQVVEAKVCCRCFICLFFFPHSYSHFRNHFRMWPTFRLIIFSKICYYSIQWNMSFVPTRPTNLNRKKKKKLKKERKIKSQSRNSSEDEFSSVL